MATDAAMSRHFILLCAYKKASPKLGATKQANFELKQKRVLIYLHKRLYSMTELLKSVSLPADVIVIYKIRYAHLPHRQLRNRLSKKGLSAADITWHVALRTHMQPCWCQCLETKTLR